jgi:hypothetical protein
VIGPPHPPPPAWLNAHDERRCQRCDHDLRNQVWAGTCPICGLGYREPPALDDDGFLLDPLPCQRCDYDLRGLRPDGQCPECGLPITRSFGALLCESDESWVKTLETGAILLGSGFVLSLGGLAVLVLALLIGLLGWSLGGASVSVVGIECASFIFLFTTAVGLLLGLVGAWAVTTPDPAGLGEPYYGRVRRLLRYCVAGTTLGTVSFLLLWPFTAQSGWVATIQGATLPIAVLLAVLAFLALLIYISRLAERIPDWDLSNAARKLWRYWIIALGIAFGNMVFIVATEWIRGYAPTWYVPIYTCLFAIAAISTLVLSIATLRHFQRFNRRLTRQHRHPTAPQHPPE